MSEQRDQRDQLMSAGQGRSTRSAVLRILDANLDRAREGLRIIEEWCRFGLESSELTETCKAMRHELARWHSDEMRSARNTPDDPGTDLSHPNEQHRATIQQVLQANLCRVQEALRSVEEYGKLVSPELAQTSKQLRYRTYTLESTLQALSRRHQLARSRLYLVTAPHEHLFEVVEEALKGGLPLVQYRDKDADDGVRLANARRLCQLCHDYGALFLVNDRVDLAIAVGADGVHLGQQDLPLEVARQLLGPDRLLGCSTTNPAEMERALQGGADYIGVGPVYETPTKAGKAAAGLEYVAFAAERSPVPWFAIGGIDGNNLSAVLDAGAERVAIVRAIVQAEQPKLMTQYLLSQLHAV
jgi:thiamine-phosphate pyrophosphorylase